MEELFYKSNPWWEDDYKFGGVVRKKYIDKLTTLLSNRDIIFLTGLRRVGKTSILKNFIYNLIQNHKIEPKYIFYISLDFFVLKDLSIAEIIKEYRKIQKLSFDTKIYLFFDEVTYKESYALELKNLYDLENVKIYASSSSASLLRDKNAYLTGRQRVVEVLPLDFKEYLSFKNITVKKRDSHLLESYFESYLFDGGMPEYILSNDISYLQNLIDNIIYKDIIAFHNIRNEKVVQDFYRLLMERCGKQLSLNKVAKILDIGVDSVRRYFSYFENVYLLYAIEKFGKLNERIKNPKKIYSGDIGLRNITTGFRDKGAIFENLIFLSLKHLHPSYLYENGIEIDFITEDKMLIEVKYNSTLNEKQKKLFDTFPATEKIVIDSFEKYLEFFKMIS